MAPGGSTLTTFLAIAGTVFVMEMADKTQLAALSFSAEVPDARLVYAATVLGLALASLVSVFGGRVLRAALGSGPLRLAVGAALVLAGILVVLGR